MKSRCKKRWPVRKVQKPQPIPPSGRDSRQPPSADCFAKNGENINAQPRERGEGENRHSHFFPKPRTEIGLARTWLAGGGKGGMVHCTSPLSKLSGLRRRLESLPLSSPPSPFLKVKTGSKVQLPPLASHGFAHRGRTKGAFFSVLFLISGDGGKGQE